MGAASVVALRPGFRCNYGRGEYWAYGTSGSGKSTLLNILGCLDRPTSESSFSRAATSRLETTSFPNFEMKLLDSYSNLNLIQQLTVLENIEVPLLYRKHPPSDARERAVELAERVGLADRLRHRPNELSGGQQQRVAIARSIVK